jgi:hypothetical protein
VNEYEIGVDNLTDGTKLYMVFRAGTRILEAEFTTYEEARAYADTLEASRNEDQ